MRKTIPWMATLGLLSAAPLYADSTQARCDIYPKGEDQASASLPCVFSQRQGFVSIQRDDGVHHELTPMGDEPGNYQDQDGQAAYRQSGLGDQGLIFRLADESVYVYWSTRGLPGNEPDPDNPTWPYTSADYDATTLLPCGTVADGISGSCPAGILRMDGGEASIVVMSPTQEEFTLNFMTDYVNATGGREVDASMDGDTWEVTVNGEELYLVPLAAIEGG